MFEQTLNPIIRSDGRPRLAMGTLLATEAIVDLIASVIFLLFPYQLIGFFGTENESIYYTQFAIWFIRGQLCRFYVCGVYPYLHRRCNYRTKKSLESS